MRQNLRYKSDFKSPQFQDEEMARQFAAEPRPIEGQKNEVEQQKAKSDVDPHKRLEIFVQTLVQIITDLPTK